MKLLKKQVTIQKISTITILHNTTATQTDQLVVNVGLGHPPHGFVQIDVLQDEGEEGVEEEGALEEDLSLGPRQFGHARVLRHDAAPQTILFRTIGRANRRRTPQ